MKKAWLRKVTSLAQGHMAWKRQSQNSKPCLFDYKSYALMPCCLPSNLAVECLYASAGPPSWPLYSLDLPEPRPGGCELWPPCQARQDCWATRPKLKKMKSQTGQVGEKQSLKCEAAAGNPLPSYRWFKDGKELNRSRDIRIKYGNGRKNSRLQFNKVKLEDAGEYVCEAENILGKDTVRGRLFVNSVSTTLSSWSGHARKCNETAKSYCVNGGVCYYIEGINQLSCKCPNGFFGQRCLEKLPLRLYMPDPKQSVLWDTPGTGVSSSQWSTSPSTLDLN
uniref:Pro-neuregulin-2, membrane-bound isoform n=1 Tax=Capra hircus TaxID=9925 RepID=A0A8C2PCW2_CAPHI